MTDATTRRASSLDENRLVTTYHPEGTSDALGVIHSRQSLRLPASDRPADDQITKIRGMQERNDRLRVARRSEPLPKTETHNRTGRHGKIQVVQGAGQALHGPRQARVPGIGGKVYEEIRVPRPDDVTRIGPSTPNGIGFAARAERQRHTGHPGGSLPQRQNHVLLEHRVLSEGAIPVSEEVDAVYRGGIQQVTAKPLEIGAVAKAPRNDRDDDTARPDRADRESEECRVEIRGRDPQLEAVLAGRPGAQLLVGRVQYGRVESSSENRSPSSDRVPHSTKSSCLSSMSQGMACLARPANGPRAPLQERPERGIEFERGDRERTETGPPGQHAGRERREQRAGTRSRVQHSHGLAIRFAHRSHKPRHPHRREILAQGDLALGNESGPGGPSDHGPLGEEAISDFGRCVGDPEPGRTVVSGRDAPIDGAAGGDRPRSRVGGEGRVRQWGRAAVGHGWLSGDRGVTLGPES